MYSKTLALVIAPAVAPLASAQTFVVPCEVDIATYCNSVTPRDGRPAACLYAHSDRVTGTCHVATTATDSIIEAFFDVVARTYETCATDIQTHCADVAQGDGRIMACLMRNAAEIEAVCVTAVRKLSAAMKQ
ncbi:cysteine rich repeat domain protein, putative [Roseobacter sp. AzwK-3b]|nr:cysteine rich repeat domain protein, putative [Roseobacter sp. AzwK-3b]